MSLVNNDPWGAGILSPLAWIGEGVLSVTNPTVVQTGEALKPFDWSDPFGSTLDALVPDIEGPLGFLIEKAPWLIVGTVACGVIYVAYKIVSNLPMFRAVKIATTIAKEVI